MLHTMWSVKGGSGVSVTAAATVLTFARERGRALVVDLRGDQPAVLGLVEPRGPGVRDWLASADASAAALDRLMIDAGHGVWLLPAGSATSWPSDRPDLLVAELERMRCEVVVDAGVIDGPDLQDRPLVALGRTLAASGRSLLVVRSCYLTIRRAMMVTAAPDGLVVVVEPDRSVPARQVATALGTPLAATVAIDPAVARSVDSGQLLRRPRRALGASVRGVA